MIRTSFVRAASRIAGRSPSSFARRVASQAGRLLRSRGESHCRQVACFVRVTGMPGCGVEKYE
ncbi:hypothetical protein HMPREF9012_1577 [Bacteroidetes bacterium oral taxon 272 str. F0290]|nr:hypothetical protein HMPREF9012_1577 [Bacteroidetes bacterium oral taxon 272 str. F0290]